MADEVNSSAEKKLTNEELDALRADYYKAKDEWNRKKDEINKKIDEEVESRLRAKEKEFADEAEKKFSQDAEKINGETAELEKLSSQLGEAAKKVSGILVFKKMAAEKKAFDAADRLEEKQAELKKAETVLSSEKAIAYYRASSQKKILRDKIAENYPMPAEPVAPKEIERDVKTSKLGANGEFKEAILSTLSDGKGRTVTDVMNDCALVSDLSNQRVSAILRQMTEDGLIRREIIKRMAYFYMEGND